MENVIYNVIVKLVNMTKMIVNIVDQDVRNLDLIMESVIILVKRKSVIMIK